LSKDKLQVITFTLFQGLRQFFVQLDKLQVITFTLFQGLHQFFVQLDKLQVILSLCFKAVKVLPEVCLTVRRIGASLKTK
jgi:hypothetical protein